MAEPPSPTGQCPRTSRSHRDCSAAVASVPECDSVGGRGQTGEQWARVFDEQYCLSVGDEFGQAETGDRSRSCQSPAVEMVESGNTPGLFFYSVGGNEREGGALDGCFHPERAADAAYERRLTGAERSLEHDEVAGLQVAGDPAADRFGLSDGSSVVLHSVTITLVSTV